ncbi:thermonuclease family protein [Sediminibacterium ginsengisoli]|nr:thermonuclease family protein [Sediminibacterium ginsengisoli]
MKFFLKSWVFIFLLLTGCGDRKKSKQVPLIFEASIIRITDGDTYHIVYNGEKKTVRLAHIDCAEILQPYGEAAKSFAATLCLGKKVVVRTTGKTDRYKRIVGEIILINGINLNKELIRNGLAWHFKQYSDDLEYAVLELAARKQHIGIWTQENPVAPWVWRHK